MYEAWVRWFIHVHEGEHAQVLTRFPATNYLQLLSHMILQPPSTRFSNIGTLSALPHWNPLACFPPTAPWGRCYQWGWESSARWHMEHWEKNKRPVSLQNAEDHGTERNLWGSSNSKTHLSLKFRTYFSGKKSLHFLMKCSRAKDFRTEHRTSIISPFSSSSACRQLPQSLKLFFKRNIIHSFKDS